MLLAILPRVETQDEALAADGCSKELVKRQLAGRDALAAAGLGTINGTSCRRHARRSLQAEEAGLSSQWKF